MCPAVGHVDRGRTCWHQQQKLDWLVYTLSRIQSVHAVSISFVVLSSFQIARKYLLGSRSTFINLAWVYQKSGKVGFIFCCSFKNAKIKLSCDALKLATKPHQRSELALSLTFHFEPSPRFQ